MKTLKKDYERPKPQMYTMLVYAQSVIIFAGSTSIILPRKKTTAFNEVYFSVIFLKNKTFFYWQQY